MNDEKNDVFFILLKLKSYLISLIDIDQNHPNKFIFTEEYFDRCFPERKNEIINLLLENNITGDCDIAFNEKIHIKFKEIAIQEKEILNLKSILEKFDIISKDIFSNEIAKQNYISERETLLRILLENLYKLAKEWSIRKEIEKNVDNYSVLNDTDMLRPNEEIRLDNLDVNASISFERISANTKNYLNTFAEYYFRYGGDINLDKFLNYLDELKDSVSQKYNNLLKENGINPNSLKNND